METALWWATALGAGALVLGVGMLALVALLFAINWALERLPLGALAYGIWALAILLFIAWVGATVLEEVVNAPRPG